MLQKKPTWYRDRMILTVNAKREAESIRYKQQVAMNKSLRGQGNNQPRILGGG